MVNDVDVSYDVRDDGYVYRISKWEGEKVSYVEESLVGPARTARVQVESDTIKWQSDEKLKTTISFTHWNKEIEDFQRFYPEVSQIPSVELKVRLHGRRSVFTTFPVDVGTISKELTHLDFIGQVSTKLSATPSPGTLFDLSTEIPGYSNIPAVIAVI